MRRRFVFKLANSANDIQRGVGHLSATNYFLQSVLLFLDKLNTQISEDFELFIRKIEFLQFPKITFKCNDHKVYLTVGNLHCLLKH